MSVHLSTTGAGAGAWLHAPIKGVIPLSNEEFSTAAKLRLDKAHTPSNTTCYRTSRNKTCCQMDNEQCDHALSCKYGAYRVSRHNALRDELTDLIAEVTGHRSLQDKSWASQQATKTTMKHPSTDQTSHSLLPTRHSTSTSWLPPPLLNKHRRVPSEASPQA